MVAALTMMRKKKIAQVQNEAKHSEVEVHSFLIHS
ncbi:hypothetical protein HNQ64_000058 [Prosthecobacter dejongeii]|uniref:Uncharacterized protein n=1 Tax=Prosthecobacter dejongeii TaxID=48465 RepID=A0A7W8DMT7_9BACT|nr:hypothetical protein [Prosthecobacter dejongeii]